MRPLVACDVNGWRLWHTVSPNSTISQSGHSSIHLQRDAKRSSHACSHVTELQPSSGLQAFVRTAGHPFLQHQVCDTSQFSFDSLS